MAASVSKSQGRSFLVGLVLIGVVAFCGYFALHATEGPPATEHTQVRAEFSDIGQLQTGDDVRKNSVRIGRISAISQAGGQAIVTMELQGRWTIHRDARAAMWDQSALGQKFVELYGGTPAAGPLRQAVIPRSQTTSATDIDQLLDVLDRPTREATGSAVRQLGSGVAGQSQNLHQFLATAPALLRDVRTVAGTLASPRTDLPSVLDSAEQLSAQLSGRTENLESLLRRTNETLRAVNVDGTRPLAGTIKELPDTLHNVRSVHDALLRPLDDVRSAMSTLRPGARSLGAATPDLRGTLREAGRPLDKVPGVARTATPAVRDLTGTFRSARPLVPRLNTALAELNPFLAALAPYSVDIPALASGGAGFTNDQVRDDKGLVFGHVRILPVIRPGTLGGLFQEGFNPYPRPGTATKDGSGSGELNGGGR